MPSQKTGAAPTESGPETGKRLMRELRTNDKKKLKQNESVSLASCKKEPRN